MQAQSTTCIPLKLEYPYEYRYHYTVWTVC
jgi:hypothetical protein